MPEAGFEPSSADYNITYEAQCQRDFGAFSPGNVSPKHHPRACTDFLFRFRHETMKKRRRTGSRTTARVVRFHQSFGRKHPEIGEDASDRQQDAQSDAEDGVPVFGQVTFHKFKSFPFEGERDGPPVFLMRRKPQHAEHGHDPVESGQRTARPRSRRDRPRPHRKIGPRKKLKKKRLDGRQQPEGAVRDRFAHSELPGLRRIRLKSLDRTQVRAAGSDPQLNTGPLPGMNGSQIAGAFGLGADASRKVLRNGRGGGISRPRPDRQQSQHIIQQQDANQQPGGKR